jgi:hypothetical protein
MYGGPGLPPDAVARALDRVALDSPHPDVKAAFLYARAFRTNRDRNATAADRRAAALNLEMAERLAPDSRYAEMAERLHFEITRLQIGMPAPEIEGTDLEGKPMKLSDFRGKVVVLDFWGDW